VIRAPVFVPFATATLVGAGIAALGGMVAGSTAATDDQSAVAATRTTGETVRPAALELSQTSSRRLGPTRGDPFFVAPKPVPAPLKPAPSLEPIVPPPPPPAPPFPYRFVGRVIGPVGEPVVYLANGERLLTVRGKGDLGDGYRVDEVSDRHVVITHGASQQKNVIEFGAESDSQRAP